MVLYIVGSVVGLVVVITIIGYLLPRDHVATRTSTFAAEPAVVWREMVALSREPKFERGISFAIDEEVPPTSTTSGRRVTRIADDKLPFGGRWIYEVEPAGGATRLTITEEGFVKNPIFRFLSATVFRQTATIEKFMREVGRRVT
jgi:hypothetical protein